VRDLFRRYVDSRLETYRKLPDVTSARAELAQSLRLQTEIWNRSVAACRTPEGQPATMLVLPALNQMFDIVTTRTVALRNHPPGDHFYDAGRLDAGRGVLCRVGMAAGKPAAGFTSSGSPSSWPPPSMSSSTWRIRAWA